MKVEIRPATSRENGMTLVELVMVIALLGVMAFAMAPRFNAYNDIARKTAVKELAADVRFAQSRAIATRVRHGLVFDAGAERYTVYRGDPGTPASSFLKPGRPLQKRLEGVDIVVAEFDGAVSFEFDSMGVPYNAAGDELYAVGFVVLSGGSQGDTVRVRALTGRVEL